MKDMRMNFEHRKLFPFTASWAQEEGEVCGWVAQLPDGTRFIISLIAGEEQVQSHTALLERVKQAPGEDWRDFVYQFFAQDLLASRNQQLAQVHSTVAMEAPFVDLLFEKAL